MHIYMCIHICIYVYIYIYIYTRSRGRGGPHGYHDLVKDACVYLQMYAYNIYQYMLWYAIV